MNTFRIALRSSQIITGLAAVIIAAAPECRGQALLALGSSNPHAFGLPNDLQVVLEWELTNNATYYCLQHWQDHPPMPANWCAGRSDVSYYVSPSLGLAKVFVDDPALDSGMRALSMDSDGPPTPEGGGTDDGSGGGTGGGRLAGLSPPPGYQPGHIWLEIFADTN